MEFRLLGPLEAGDEAETLTLGPRKQRALLARLLLDAGRTVSVERLLDDLWGEDLPETAVKMVQIYVSGLRKVLGAERLVTRPGGYCLEPAGEDEIDLRRFERLVAAARGAADADDHPAAAARLRDALALWRGPALAEFSSEPFARAEGDRLEESRLAAAEDRIGADLACGRAAEVVGEIEALASRHPLRERLREQLMLALHRSGRQSEALAAYQDFRSALDDQLGLDPSPRLRGLEQAILTHDPSLEATPPPAAAPSPAAPAHRPAGLVAPPGRADELEVLEAALGAAASGSRRLVLVAGEPGLGKSTLVEALIDAAGDALVIAGQCAEQEGASEPYLPLLDGLGRAAGDPDVAATVTARAPSWLAQLPWIAAVTPAERATGATGERMLREMVEALEALAAARTVLVVVEDLQWSDPSTRDLLTALARRRHPARLLIVATTDGGHPPLGELSLLSAARELVLRPLDAEAAAAAFDVAPDLAAELARRGGGNPLFMRHLAEHLAATGSLDGVPATLEAALQARLAEGGEDELELLRAAAVEGVRFTAAGVAAAVGRPFSGLDGVTFVRPDGSVEWPDGTVTDAFRFVHPLVREVLLRTIPAARAAELHRRMGERLETAYGPAPETAGSIAAHYVEGRLAAPAVRFLRLAAGQCIARRAYREAVGHLTQALDAAGELEDGPVRRRLETELLSELGQAHVALEGWSSPTALAHLERARVVADGLEDKEPLAAVLLALGTLFEVRGEPESALAAIGPATEDGSDATEVSELLACALFHQGAFTRALDQADRGAAAFERGGDGGHYSTFPATFGDNAGIACHDWAALSLWFLGQAGESLRRARHAFELSEEPGRSHSAATASAQLAALHACRGEPADALRWAQSTVDAARDRGFAYRLAMGRVLRGWARAADGHADGLEELSCGLRASHATGAHLEDPFYLGLLADAQLRAGAPEPGLAAANEALEIAARERAHYYDAELHRLRGELLLAAGHPADEAERAIREALRVAREQSARSLELRAALALVRTLEGTERAAEARATVAVALEPLAGEDTPDVRAATALVSGEPSRARAESVRRRITALAWEVARIDELIDHLDADRLPAVVSACHAAVREAVEAEGGHVVGEEETGGLVYFGYPRALEDGPLRAVRAARALTGAERDADGVGVRLCAGLDTGGTVVGAATPTAGRTPRTAWKLAHEAGPGDVLVSAATGAWCEGYFTLAPLGPAHRVTGETGARTRLDARGPELSPLVGRERELALLEGRWEQAAEGLGQAVLLTGEAGIGKSRLARELVSRPGPAAGTLLDFQCADTRSGSALHPVADHFQRRLADGPHDLEGLLGEAGAPGADGAPVLAALLGLPGAGGAEPATLKSRTTDVVVGYVLAHAEQGPVVVVIEDVHWADPSTLDLLEVLIDAIAEARVLLILTLRPSLRLPWLPQSHATRLSLAPCTRGEAEELLAHLAPEGLPPAVAQAVVDRSDGVPLFVEELASSAAAGVAEVPATLHDSLMARLDALGPAAREAARLGALIGREFPRDLIAAASELHGAELDAGLDELVDAGLLRRRGRAAPVRFAFRHALLREAVSRSPAGRTRRALHLQIAQALQRTAPEIARTEPDTVARHLEEAGEPGRAVSYRFEAGRLALSRSANLEAVEQLSRAVSDLDEFADHESRADIELDLRVLLGNALISVRGYASPDVADNYSRARELCRRTGDDARLLPVLYGLWVNGFVQAQHTRVLALGRELRELAERRDPGAMIVAERAVGWPLFCLGRFAEAREHLDRVAERSRPAESLPLRFLYGQDPAVAGLATGAWALWGCGESAAADERAALAIALGRETEHPLTLTYALGSGALLAALRGDPARAREWSLEAIAVTEEYRFPLWRAWSRYALGWAQLREGDAVTAGATLRDAIVVARGTGAALFEPFALTTLAEAEAGAGNPEGARRCLAAADAAVEASGEVFWQPRTRRVADALLARAS